MPKISSRGLAMPESPIRKLVPFADKARSKGVEVIHLNIGQPDIKTPEIAIDSIKNIDLKVIEYSHSAGFESYRKGLAKYYSEISKGISYEDIMVTTGGSEALAFGFSVCMNPGDEIIIPEPFYANYNGFAIAAGVKVQSVYSDIKSGFALPPIEEFEKKINKNTKGILICNPGNPTGHLYSQAELNQLKEIVAKHDLYLFADEVYREFCYDGKVHHSILNLEGVEDNVIVVDSVSKRYSMCGARIGALVSRNKEFMKAALKFGQARLSPPTLAQIASEAALDTPDSYFEEVNKEYIERRDLLIDGLNGIDGVFCPKPGGAFYAVAELPVDDSDHFCQWILEDFALNGQTVMMAPASGFYASDGKGKQQVRLAYVLEKKKLQNAVDCLTAALKKYNEK